jgi:putative membrane protein
MLPRFLVHWAQVAPGLPENTLWAERCQRLRRIILNPGLIIVWLLGLLLGFHLGWPLWLWAKLAIVLGLTLYHHWMLRVMKAFARSERPISEKALRLANEIPSLTTIAIVILVVVKPF